jgi:DNA-directed RNA polymerase specialized sigma24 family protein
MPTDGSVTRWLRLLQAGDPAAAQHLWERYFGRLVGLARKKLQGAPKRVADEEDVALSAFDTFCRNAERGRFPHLLDRDSLWRLLVVITVRKAAHLRRDQSRKKRGGAAAEAGPPPDAAEGDCLASVLGREPDPAFAAQLAEEYQQLLQCLGDAELRAVAVARMQGDSIEEIAARLDYVPRSIKRKLQLIREIWEKEIGRESDQCPPSRARSAEE